MAVVSMKFVSACTDREHLDQMLLTGLNAKMLHPVSADQIINEENHGVLLNEENPWSTHLQSLKTLCSGLDYVPRLKSSTERKDPADAVAQWIAFIREDCGISEEGETAHLSREDQKALDALSECDFARINACQYLVFRFGRMPRTSFAQLSKYKDEVLVHHRLYANKQVIWLVYVTSDSYAAKADQIFRSLQFEQLPIPKVSISAKKEQYKDELDDLYTYCTEQNDIRGQYPYVAVLDEKYILSGFVPEKQVDAYEKMFARESVDFRIKNPADVKVPCPTLLKNNWFARPFEMFVEMYSLPAYGEFDPTFFLAVTYCILFGIMFGDMGQGLVLVLLGFLLEKKGRLFGIIGRVGITSTIFGFLFGSLFGYEDALNPLHQSLFHVREKLFDVMASSSTMMLLIGAVVIGAVLILTAMAINIACSLKHKRYGELLFSQNGIAGFVFYGFILAAIAGKFLWKINLLNPVLIALCIVLPVVCFVFKEPFTALVEGKSPVPEGGWGGYITQSLFEVLEIMLSFVTNSMSYLRVGGFVLSHAGMMLVVMTLVKMAGAGGPAVVVFGNAFVMVLEGLIVGIQTLRLEYYEMFSRYYAGGGIRYQAAGVQA